MLTSLFNYTISKSTHTKFININHHNQPKQVKTIALNLLADADSSWLAKYGELYRGQQRR